MFSAYDNGQSSDTYLPANLSILPVKPNLVSQIFYTLSMGTVIEFLIEKPVSGQFSILIHPVAKYHKHCMLQFCAIHT